MDISAQLVKQLRDLTGAGMMDCRKALEEAGGDINKAVEELRKASAKVALKKQDRATGEGVVEAYIHPGAKLGVLVKLVCETDFVARNPEFQQLAKDIALQIAAMNPQYLKPEDVPAAVIEKEKEIYREQLTGEGKPAAVQDKIIGGKLQKFYSEVCLYRQASIKDDKMTVEDMIVQVIAKIGENIRVTAFTRYTL